MTPPRPRRVLAPLAALALGALVLAGCTHPIARPAPSATTLPGGVTATLLPATPAQTAQEVRLWVTNGTEDDLAVTRVRLSDPRFVGYARPSTTRTITVGAGTQAEVVLTLPEVECRTEPTSTPTPTVPAPPADDPTASPTPTPTPTPTASAPVTTLIFGFTVGAASGVTAEQVNDPDGVIAAYLDAQCP